MTAQNATQSESGTTATRLGDARKPVLGRTFPATVYRFGRNDDKKGWVSSSADQVTSGVNLLVFAKQSNGLIVPMTTSADETSRREIAVIAATKGRVSLSDFRSQIGLTVSMRFFDQQRSGNFESNSVVDLI